MNTGTLYVVATPIGNLQDITLRALDVLKEVDGIVCEDTRVTSKLLSHYGISKELYSFNAHAEENKIENIIQALISGRNLALVTDAGTPSISDPGSKIVEIIQEKHRDEIKVVAIPGPSALTAALSISGVPASEFVFLGFLPHKKGRQTLFTEIAQSERPVVFYESTHRLMKALGSLKEFCPNKKVVVVKEITKIFEEVISGNAESVLAYFEAHPDKERGEFVVIVS
jgi:16S rRNA (cytidine1402-2'-O)-methyltransferase